MDTNLTTQIEDIIQEVEFLLGACHAAGLDSMVGPLEAVLEELYWAYKEAFELSE